MFWYVYLLLLVKDYIGILLQVHEGYSKQFGTSTFTKFRTNHFNFDSNKKIAEQIFNVVLLIHQPHHIVTYMP